MVEQEKGAVCVTGATGYLASWLVMKLLQQGYTVHATVRSEPKHKKDISFLKNLPKATEKLRIFNANLDHPCSFDKAIKGCIGVFHLAHPIDLENKESEETITKRALDGLMGVLNASLKSKTVKRVVYTSSLGAVLYNNSTNRVADESTWSDINVCRSVNSVSTSYMVSKTLTEKTALKFAEEYDLEVVSLVLSLVAGPFVCPSIPSSVSMALAMVLGIYDQFKDIKKMHMVHIDDVADALIFLLDYPNAKGRYICYSAETTFDQIHNKISKKYPNLKLPNKSCSKNSKSSGKRTVSTKKLLESGFNFKYNVDDMLDGAIQCCKEKGFL